MKGYEVPGVLDFAQMVPQGREDEAPPHCTGCGVVLNCDGSDVEHESRRAAIEKVAQEISDGMPPAPEGEAYWLGASLLVRLREALARPKVKDP